MSATAPGRDDGRAAGEALFVYGSLLPGLAPPELGGLLAALRPLGRATLRGALYDLGEHPGAVPDPASATSIAGELFELPRGPELIARLDAYEGVEAREPLDCDAGLARDPALRSAFARVRCRVSVARGELDCWVYAWRGDPRGATRIASGDWLAHLRARRGARSDQR